MSSLNLFIEPFSWLNYPQRENKQTICHNPQLFPFYVKQNPSNNTLFSFSFHSLYFPLLKSQYCLIVLFPVFILKLPTPILVKLKRSYSAALLEFFIVDTLGLVFEHTSSINCVHSNGSGRERWLGKTLT